MAVTKIYLRVKRQKTTLFVECDPTDAVSSVKSRISSILSSQSHTIDVKDIKLLVPKELKDPNGGIPKTVLNPVKLKETKMAELENNAILNQVGADDDCVVYMVFWVPGEGNSGEGKWEQIDIPEPEPLEAEPEYDTTEIPQSDVNLKAADKGKGKERV
ncbi:hypothetical protein BKA69DRAFT_1043684 [Paraphysoderma sedebokerense]|nr:hypothetical protein BKA69DRAFT_1043684 [Paraphysoderma sedebokerense]